jgi:NAD(P)-dependent dehydrogenase (short-subunit alcohol dehydrogenase family)
MDLGLKGRVAIVTGGSDGIGKAAATAMAREGAKVAIAARTQSLLDEAVADIKRESGSADVIGVSTDVRNEDSVKSLIKTVTDKWGGLDILVNNAGTSSASKLDDMTNEALTEDLNIKVYGAVYCMRNALPFLRKSSAAAVVNTTTPGGKASPGGSQPTSLSRAAGISLTKAWSKEFAPENIRVNTVCVGVLKSRQHRRRWEAMHEKDPGYSLDDHWKSVGKNVPMGRIGEAQEAGDVIAFLCSERASYITGSAVNVDGGTSPVV